MRRRVLLTIAALMAASCVYEFEPEGVVSQKRIVIEGDILIGGMTTIDVRSTMPVTYEEDFDMSSPIGKAWVEDSEGGLYEEKLAWDQYFEYHSSFTIDTREASPLLSYRLHFSDYMTGNHYVSRWQQVVPAPAVTGMSFDYDLENVNIMMDLDGKDGRYFRWDYVEDWEYHAEYAPTYYFDLDANLPRYFDENSHMADYSNYWCWGRAASKEFGLASTENQSRNVLENMVILSEDRGSLRFQTYYRVDVTVRSLEKDAYDYLHNMKEISNLTGSLFSPSPDDMRGNIICLQDTTEFVIGYVSAVQIEKHRMYIRTGENLFYKEPKPATLFEPDFTNGFSSYLDYYKNGYRPVTDIFITDPETNATHMAIGWGPSGCAWCQALGGSKKRPDDWPTATR